MPTGPRSPILYLACVKCLICHISVVGTPKKKQPLPFRLWYASKSSPTVILLWPVPVYRLCWLEYSLTVCPCDVQEVCCVEFHPVHQILASGSCDFSVKFYEYSKPSVKKASKSIQVVSMLTRHGHRVFLTFCRCCCSQSFALKIVQVRW